jgi:hypothetical protein
MSSPLAQVIAPTPASTDKAARAAWRAKQWRAGQKAKHEQRLHMAALQGELSWRDIANIPIEHDTPGPARECQWISDDGCLCNAPSVFGRSWCGKHARRVFVGVDDPAE